MKLSEKNNFKFFNKKPIKSIYGIYVYILIVVIIVGLVYIYNLDDITNQALPLRLSTQTVEKDLELKEAKVIPPVDVFSFLEPSPEIIAKGKSIFENSCSSCHGTSGMGNGPAGATLTPLPKDFTDNTGWKNGTNLSDIYKTLEEGIPGSAMGSYSYLLPEEKLSLSVYIRSAFVKNAPEVTDEDLLDLDLNYDLSEGASIPAQIPVKYATKILINEKKSVKNKINNILQSIKTVEENIGKDLFYKVTDNQFKALITLNSDQRWKNDQKLFIDIIVDNALNNGFNGYVYRLSSSQWDDLYRFINGQFK